MMPIWPCWERERSEASSLMASLFVLSLMISAICTAWPWWTIMSRAKASLGGVVVGRQGGQQHRQRDACGQDGHDGEQHEWSVVPIGWGGVLCVASVRCRYSTPRAGAIGHLRTPVGRTSENAVSAKFAEFTFYVLG